MFSETILHGKETRYITGENKSRRSDTDDSLSLTLTLTPPPLPPPPPPHAHTHTHILLILASTWSLHAASTTRIILLGMPCLASQRLTRVYMGTASGSTRPNPPMRGYSVRARKHITSNGFRRHSVCHSAKWIETLCGEQGATVALEILVKVWVLECWQLSRYLYPLVESSGSSNISWLYNFHKMLQTFQDEKCPEIPGIKAESLFHNKGWEFSRYLQGSHWTSN